MKIKTTSKTKVSSVWVDFEDHLGNGSVILTEWSNGEGYDIFTSYSKNSNDEVKIGLTEFQLRSLIRAYKDIRKNEISRD